MRESRAYGFCEMNDLCTRRHLNACSKCFATSIEKLRLSENDTYSRRDYEADGGCGFRAKGHGERPVPHGAGL